MYRAKEPVRADHAQADAGYRVLVVDDNRLQRAVLRSSLTRWGYRVEEAGSAEEAIALATLTPPDLVLSDWMMPGMNGLEFCRAFRAMEREDYGYFVLLTSKAEKTNVAEGLDSGADDFLTKPVNSGELRARLNAGERILAMQRELRHKNRLISDTLNELQTLYDSIDSDLVEAKKLQQSLVRERFRDFGSAKLSLTLSPAGHVGGDLVGHFPAGEGVVGLYAIDVSGHGISSALMTARLAGYLSPAAPEQNLALLRRPDGGFAPRPPAEVAAHLNRLVLAEVETEHYFTLVIALCDLRTGAVRMAQCGHPHPLLQAADGQVRQVGQGGMPVGLIRDAEYDEVAFQLRPGDRLLLVSDGMVECPNQVGGIIGEEGLIAMLAGLADIPGPPLLETLIWSLDQRNPQPDFPDDISAILFEFSG
ncbi:PP2C family protein-serine/threonine phosphatase [Pseudooceanicola pacificus]|uniref:PP2C family protein-serine/threonine phosphatase n=1 Tax=Pseudooceanicola pacificus TaxID=2676438 RepID=UPI0019228712|nr:SpoIIE family protein phosphatase [Pseudooceanicola pacificus]